MKRKRPIQKGYLEPIHRFPPIEDNTLRVERVVLKSVTFSQVDGIRLVCDTVIFNNCTITDNVLEHAEFIDCIFEDTLFTNNRFTHSMFVRCEFKRTKVDGSHIIESMMEHTLFKDCHGTYLDLSNNTIKVLEIEDSVLDESSWFENTLSHITFVNVSLRKSDFYQTSLSNIDLSTSNIEGMKTDARGIKGAIISPTQAVLLCSLLGVTVKDD